MKIYLTKEQLEDIKTDISNKRKQVKEESNSWQTVMLFEQIDLLERILKNPYIDTDFITDLNNEE